MSAADPLPEQFITSVTRRSVLARRIGYGFFILAVAILFAVLYALWTTGPVIILALVSILLLNLASGRFLIVEAGRFAAIPGTTRGEASRLIDQWVPQYRKRIDILTIAFVGSILLLITLAFVKTSLTVVITLIVVLLYLAFLITWNLYQKYFMEIAMFELHQN
jgi:hypothetical protein